MNAADGLIRLLAGLSLAALALITGIVSYLHALAVVHATGSTGLVAYLIWLSRGISTKAVAEFIGDTKHTVISTYSHSMPDDRDKARRAMEDFMNGPAEDPSQTATERSELKIVP